MVLKRVLTRVDFPRPDSPVRVATRRRVEFERPNCERQTKKKRTDDHSSKLETLADALAVDLVGEVGKADVAHELFADYGDGGDVGLAKGGF